MKDVAEDIREQLLALLEHWRSGEYGVREVHERAEVIYGKAGWREYPETDSRSIVFEVLSMLEMLNQQLVCLEDIPEMLTFLATPRGKERDAWRRWKKYWDSIDFEKRRLELSDNPYYVT